MQAAKAKVDLGFEQLRRGLVKETNSKGMVKVDLK